MLKAKITFTNKTLNFTNGLGKAVDIAVGRSIKRIARNVKVNTPVKEGHLRRSIASRKLGKGAGEVYNAATQGGKEINYAIYLEYGTKFMAPRAMFRKGVGQSQKEIKEFFREEARKVKTGL